MILSIITVTLNSKKTVISTLNSILSQTYDNIEHIIVDGGSTDGTIEILKNYRNKNTNGINNTLFFSYIFQFTNSESNSF